MPIATNLLECPRCRYAAQRTDNMPYRNWTCEMCQTKVSRCPIHQIRIAGHIHEVRYRCTCPDAVPPAALTRRNVGRKPRRGGQRAA